MAEKSVNVAFITSVRDVGGDDHVGQWVGTKDGPQYMEGVIERCISESLPGGTLHGIVRVVLIVTDDRPKDVAPFGYSAMPEVCGKQNGRWIFPPDLACDELGTPARLLVRNILSEFRSIPKRDPVRAEAKRAFERQVLDAARRCDAEVLVSDHYMAKIEYLNGEFGLYGRVLNIHPAVTKLDCPFCFRGPTPTADALKMARDGHTTRTGATLHLVNEEFDDGPIIEWDAPTPVYPDDTPEELRYRNYQVAKLPVFIRGLQKYVKEWLPRF